MGKQLFGKEQGGNLKETAVFVFERVFLKDPNVKKIEDLGKDLQNGVRLCQVYSDSFCALSLLLTFFFLQLGELLAGKKVSFFSSIVFL